MKPIWPDSRGWVSIGLFTLTTGVFALMAFVPDLRKDDLFKMLAQTVVVSGLVNQAASFYFGASKSTPPDGDGK